MGQLKIADVSRWQGVINWDALKNQVDGVVIKATGSDGGLYTDGQFVRNRNEARRVGLPIWFYHYKGSGASTADQAKYFLGAIGGLKAGEGLVLDDENAPKVDMGFTAIFADEIKKATGLNIVHYSYQAHYVGVDLGVLRSRNIGVWCAKYGINNGTLAGAGAAPAVIGATVIMWQYTSTARVSAITANSVDLSVFYGDVNDFCSYGAKGVVAAPKPSTIPNPTPTPSTTDGYYTVVSGDSLSKIGNKVGLAWQSIAAWNGLRSPYIIYPGQRLKVFGGSAQAASQPQSLPARQYYVVSGDTLSGIGAKTGVAWSTIAKLNGIPAPYTIYPGQILNLTGIASVPKPNTTPTYTVQSGDTLSGIGAKVGVSWQKIASINGIHAPYTIYPKQVLRLN